MAAGCREIPTAPRWRYGLCAYLSDVSGWTQVLRFQFSGAMVKRLKGSLQFYGILPLLPPALDSRGGSSTAWMAHAHAGPARIPDLHSSNLIPSDSGWGRRERKRTHCRQFAFAGLFSFSFWVADEGPTSHSASRVYLPNTPLHSHMRIRYPPCD